MPMNLHGTIILQVCCVSVDLEKSEVTICDLPHKERMLLAYVCLMWSADGGFLFVSQGFAHVNTDGPSLNTVLKTELQSVQISLLLLT